MIRTKDALISEMDKGRFVRETRLHEPEDKSVWNMADTGEAVHGQAVSLTKIARGFEPLADGLFGEAQTYGIKPEVVSES